MIDKVKNSKILVGPTMTVASLTGAVMFVRYFNGKEFSYEDVMGNGYKTLLFMIALASLTLLATNIYRMLGNFKVLYYNDAADINSIYRKFNVIYRHEVQKNKNSMLLPEVQKLIDKHLDTHE